MNAVFLSPKPILAFLYVVQLLRISSISSQGLIWFFFKGKNQKQDQPEYRPHSSFSLWETVFMHTSLLKVKPFSGITERLSPLQFASLVNMNVRF